MKGELNEEALEKMMPKNVINESRRKQIKEQFPSYLSRKGEGANAALVQDERKINCVEKKVSKEQLAIENDRQEKGEKGVFLCSVRCELTNRYCTRRFVTVKNRDEHVASGKHKFIRGINCHDKSILLSSQHGGIIAPGTLQNRQSERRNGEEESDQGAPNLEEAQVGDEGEEDAHCFGKFNRKKDITPYQKPDCLTEVLKDLYFNDGGPKLNAKQMRKKMEELVDDFDGGLMFCPSKASVNGILLSEDIIQQFIRAESQKKKKRSVSNRDDNQSDFQTQ